MVIRDELSTVIDILKKSGNDNPIFEAHLIFRHFLNMSPMQLVLDGGNELSDSQFEAIMAAVDRRCKNEPIQYILNSQEFMGLDFYVDKNVLVPRADTETLVEHILKHFVNKSFTGLEIGCGSGCITVSLAYYNKNAHMRSIDISPQAVEIAAENALKNGVSERTCFDVSDVFTYDAYGKYELIVSNPPYIETKEIEGLDDDVRIYEPHIALDGGDDGLRFYRRITQMSSTLLKKGGMLAFEVGYSQAESVCELMNNSFNDITVVKDLCGVNRVVSGLLI